MTGKEEELKKGCGKITSKGTNIGKGTWHCGNLRIINYRDHKKGEVLLCKECLGKQIGKQETLKQVEKMIIGVCANLRYADDYKGEKEKLKDKWNRAVNQVMESLLAELRGKLSKQELKSKLKEIK